jgi:antirestriction protein ArdC
MKKSAEDIRKQITEMMVKAITDGTPPWRKPWSNGTNSGSPCNFQSKRRYTGINPLILMFWSLAFNYESKFWGSASAWTKNTGAHVKRGEHAIWIALFKMIPKYDTHTKKVMKNGEGKDIMFPILREFPLFNVQQVQAPEVETLLGTSDLINTLLGVEGRKKRKTKASVEELLKIAERYLPVKSQPKKSATKKQIATAICEGISSNISRYMSIDVDMNNEPDFAPAEDFIKSTKATIHYRGDRAFYRLDTDDITVPNKRKFKSMPDFYETVFHELVHRQLAHDGWKGEYAMGELIAEIGACFTLMALNVPLADQMLDKSKSYVASWLSKMNDDPKYIFDAASLASKCVDKLLGQSVEETEEQQLERAVA